MDDQQLQPRACTGCNGNGGWVEDTSSDGITRQNWRQCGACSGSGQQQ